MAIAQAARNFFRLPEKSAMAPSMGASSATTTSEIDAAIPHRKSPFSPQRISGFGGSPTTILLKYGAYRAVTITVVNAESATSYMHQPKISLLRTGGKPTRSTLVVIQ